MNWTTELGAGGSVAGSTAESRSGGSAAAGVRRGEDKRGSFGFSAGYVAMRAPPSFPSSSRIYLSVVLVRPQAEESKFSVVPPAVGEPAQAHEVLGTRLHGETTSRRGSRKHWGSVGLLTGDPHGAAAAGGVGVEEPLGCRRSGCGGPLGAATADGNARDGGGGASEIPSEPGAAGMGELLGAASAVAFRMDLAGPPLVPPPAGSTSLPRGLGTQMVEAAADATRRTAAAATRRQGGGSWTWREISLDGLNSQLSGSS